MPSSFISLKSPILRLMMLLLVMVSGTVFSVSLAQSENGEQPFSALKGVIQYQQNKYLLGPGDVMDIQVLHEPDYSQNDILVRPDGRASFMGIGEISVANLTVEQVTDLIHNELDRTLVNPQIMLTVKNLRPGTIYLTGAVMHPGMFQFTTNTNDKTVQVRSDQTLTRTDMRLTNILANAGGVKMDADLANVTVTKSVTGEVVRVNLWKVLEAGDYQEDIWVNSGDHIDIPQLSAMAMTESQYDTLLRSAIGPGTFPVRVIGEVKTPGVYELSGTSPLLTSALAKAGGYAPEANKHVIAIRRFTSDSDFSTIYVNPAKTDITLRPNDVVFISENAVYKAGRFGNEVARILSPFTSAASAASSVSQTFGIGGWKTTVTGR